MTISEGVQSVSSSQEAYAPLRLCVRGLSCMRSERQVFKDLSFELGAGEMLTLTGPNGAGKSSLIRQVARLLDVSGGLISLEGLSDGDLIADCAVYAGHLDAVKGSLTVFENMSFWADFFGLSRVRVSVALDAFDLARLSSLPASVLSAGQKKRLGLSRLALVERPLWLLDEPTVSLDVASVARLAEMMRAHLGRGGLILAATHLDLGIEGAKHLEMGALLR